MKKIVIFLCNRFMWLGIILALGVFTCKTLLGFLCLFLGVILTYSYIDEECRLTISEIKTKEFIEDFFFSEE